MTKKQDAMVDQPGGRRYVGFNERWDAAHPDEVDKPQDEHLFDPDEVEQVEQVASPDKTPLEEAQDYLRSVPQDEQGPLEHGDSIMAGLVAEVVRLRQELDDEQQEVARMYHKFRLSDERVERLREAHRQATHYLESYCEATDPDPRADDGEEITVPDAYVLSALSSLAEGVASPDKPPELS